MNGGNRQPYEQFLGAPRCHPRFMGMAAQTRKRRRACITDAELAAVGGRGASRKQLADRAGCAMEDERCILESLGTAAAKELLAKALRPAKPADWDKDPDQWLDNHNIEAIFKQYSEIFPWFRFFGVHPIDFSAPSPYVKGRRECLIPKMCTIEIPKLRAEGVKYGGVVFNLDNHLGGGSHWVALIIDTNVKKPGVYYFDSYGMRPPKQVKRFMEDLSYEEPRATFGYNGRRFQYSNSECGMYSILFLICMMHGVPFRKFVKRAIADKYMLALRNWLFS